MVVAVPAALTFGEEVADGVETSDEVRPHIVSHVIKPHGDARQLHLQRDSLQRPHVEHQKRSVAVPFHILRAFRHRVVSQHIPPSDMLHHPHHMAAPRRNPLLSLPLRVRHFRFLTRLSTVHSLKPLLRGLGRYPQPSPFVCSYAFCFHGIVCFFSQMADLEF